MLANPFIKGEKIIKQIESHGFQAYFVGGCVRDSIIGRTIGDIDIATSATPYDLQHIFQKVIPVGIEHGTVIVRWEGESFEVTTFRLEDTYSDQRHPDNVQFVQTIDQDLKRRDFTMNAIAMDLSGKTIDPYGGKADIKQKQIRAVGNGYYRFNEDPLRIIRAIRFSSQLGFTIEKNTLHDMLQVKKQIRSLAVERLTAEITKLFAGDFITTGMAYLKDTGILETLPLFKKYPTLANKLPENMHPLHSFGEVITMLHYIYPSIPISEWVHQWKASNKTKKEADILSNVLLYYKENGVNAWFAYILPNTYAHKFVRLAGLLVQENVPKIADIIELQGQVPIQSKRDLALNGEDILNIFPNYKKGAWIGKLLLEMEHAVVWGYLKNNKNVLREWITCHPPEEN